MLLKCGRLTSVNLQMETTCSFLTVLFAYEFLLHLFQKSSASVWFTLCVNRDSHLYKYNLLMSSYIASSRKLQFYSNLITEFDSESNAISF